MDSYSLLPISGFVGRVKKSGADLFDSTRVVVQMDEEKRERLAQFKGLANSVSAELSYDVFGRCGAAETWRGYLLIPRRLLAKWLRGIGEGLFNLRHLLTAFRRG